MLFTDHLIAVPLDHDRSDGRTDEYLHNGLRTAGNRVLDRLIALTRG